MKTVMAILLGVTLACSARAYVNTAPATQAQVQAGTDAYHFVTPQTLAGAGVVTNYATWLLLTVFLSLALAQMEIARYTDGWMRGNNIMLGAFPKV